MIFLLAILILACASSSLAFLVMYSECKLNKQGDKIQPWRTPFPTWNQSVVPCPVLTVASWPAYRFLRSWTVLWRPTRPFRTNTQKRCPFHYRRLECKSRKSRNTWSNRQIWPWNVEWSRAKTNRVLTRKHTENSKHPVPTTHEMMLHMDIIRCSIKKSDWLYSLQLKIEKLYTVSKKKTRSWLWLRSWTPYCQIRT